jgi:hypothetical protein
LPPGDATAVLEAFADRALGVTVPRLVRFDDLLDSLWTPPRVREVPDQRNALDAEATALEKADAAAQRTRRIAAAAIAALTRAPPAAAGRGRAAGRGGDAPGGDRRAHRTGLYPDWRAAEPSRRWAVLVTAWYGLQHAPTRREIDDDREQPPPLPLASGAGLLRRGLLRAAAGGRSVRCAAEQVDWFVPLHGYDETEWAAKVAAAVREAELLGVVGADVLTDAGEALAALHDCRDRGREGGGGDRGSGDRGGDGRCRCAGRPGGRCAAGHAGVDARAVRPDRGRLGAAGPGRDAGAGRRRGA